MLPRSPRLPEAPTMAACSTRTRRLRRLRRRNLRLRVNPIHRKEWHCKHKTVTPSVIALPRPLSLPWARTLEDFIRKGPKPVQTWLASKDMPRRSNKCMRHLLADRLILVGKRSGLLVVFMLCLRASERSSNSMPTCTTPRAWETSGFASFVNTRVYSAVHRRL